MDAGAHRHRRFDGVDAEIMPYLLPQVGQPVFPCRFRKSCEIEKHRRIQHRHLPGDHVPGHKVFELRVFLLHEIPSLAAAQGIEPSALAPGRLGDKKPLAGDLHGGGVVLDEFEVCKLHALGKYRRQRAAGVQRRTRGAAGEQAVRPAHGEDHRAGEPKRPPCERVAHVCPGAASALHIQPQKLVVRKTADKPRRLVFARLVDERGHDRLAGAAFGVGRAFFLLAAEAPLEHFSVLHLKRHAQRAEPPNDLRRVRRETVYGVGVSKIHPAAHGIGEVFPDRVVLAHEIERRVDAALRQHGLRPLRRHGGDEARFDIPFCQLNGRRQPREARAEDRHSFHIRTNSSGCNRR